MNKPFSMRWTMMCPKCYRNGALGEYCPNCGTEVFSFRSALECPAKGSKAFKKFLQNPVIKNKIDIYNANPIKDWLTKRIEKRKVEDSRKKRLKENKGAKRRRAEQFSNPKVEICEIVCIKNNYTSMPHDALNQSVWFLVRVNGTLYVYNATSLRACLALAPEPELITDPDWFTPDGFARPPFNPYGIKVGRKCKLPEILKRRLNSATRKFLGKFD